MPIKVNGAIYLMTEEACNMAGISKNTFLRWVRTGVLPDVERRDKRGWRLFTQSDLERLKAEVSRKRNSSRRVGF